MIEIHAFDEALLCDETNYLKMAELETRERVYKTCKVWDLKSGFQSWFCPSLKSMSLMYNFSELPSPHLQKGHTIVAKNRWKSKAPKATMHTRNKRLQ